MLLDNIFIVSPIRFLQHIYTTLLNTYIFYIRKQIFNQQNKLAFVVVLWKYCVFIAVLSSYSTQQKLLLIKMSSGHFIKFSISTIVRALQIFIYNIERRSYLVPTHFVPTPLVYYSKTIILILITPMSFSRYLFSLIKVCNEVVRIYK